MLLGRELAVRIIPKTFKWKKGGQGKKGGSLTSWRKKFSPKSQREVRR